jgi:hypothetical protein
LHDWSGTNKRPPIRTPQSSGLTAVIHQTAVAVFILCNIFFRANTFGTVPGYHLINFWPVRELAERYCALQARNPPARTQLPVPRNPDLLFVLNSAATSQLVIQLIIWDEIASVKQGQRNRKRSSNQQNPRETKETKNRFIIVHHERSNCYGPLSGSLR